VALVTWDQSYSVKVKSCDSEHQTLFALLNALHDAMKQGQGRKVIGETLIELEKYTRMHFAAEEALLLKAAYPKLGKHHAEHKMFVSKVAQFKRSMQTDSAETPIEVVVFLKDWLAHHIKQTDKQYSEHLNAHGIQ
jgi:hemerythrin